MDGDRGFHDVRVKCSEHNVPVVDLGMDLIGEVVDFPGPSNLKEGLLRILSSTLNSTVGSENITAVLEPRSVGDVSLTPE